MKAGSAFLRTDQTAGVAGHGSPFCATEASSKLAQILRRASGSPHLFINRRCPIMPKAIRFNQLGGPEVLHIEDQPERQPGPGEVLLKIGRASCRERG